MMKFKKDYDVKIIFVVIIVIFLSTQVLYSLPSSTETLRPPIGKLGQMDVFLKTRTYSYPAGEFDIRVSNPNNNYYKTSEGGISIGLSMLHRLLYPAKEDYPNIIVAPQGEWVGKDGANLMQIYFAIACNYFIHKRNGLDNPKTKIVCRADQVERIVEYLKSGNPYDLPNIAGYSAELMRRFQLEAIYLADRAMIGGELQMATPYPDMVEFETFSSTSKEATIGNAAIQDKGDGTFLIKEDGKEKAILDGRNMKELDLQFIGVKPISNIPDFGVTFLGTSSGMDANGLSVSETIWAGNFHILIDPGTSALSALKALGLSPKNMTYLVVTHMHEDHVAGALAYLQWCKDNDHPINLIIEPGIYELFKEQAKQILNTDLNKVYDISAILLKFYEKITLGEGDNKVTIEAIPGFHGTPVMMGRYTYKGKTISHSSDTTFDPTRFEAILRNDIPLPIRHDLLEHAKIGQDETIFDKSRVTELNEWLFKPNSSGNRPSIVIYEGGTAAPSGENTTNHTTPSDLQKLPEDLQRTIWVNHTAQLPKLQEGNKFIFNQAIPMSTLAVNFEGSLLADVTTRLSGIRGHRADL
ncbi:MAG: MBL fold metallo-hydrolase [Candidatus Omnitrophota bacterium]|nr:MBL fold metallo-hydrolase [Candidatus Omnitrophota bacterium]